MDREWFARLLLVVLFLVSPFLIAQEYFGQNQVRYRTLDFRVLKTQHFDIYYYDQEKPAIDEVGRMAERWYTRLSGILGHQLSSRQPVIVYANHADFSGTTVIPEMLGESVGGVTEPLRRRVVMPLAGPLSDTDHVLGHELVHAFQYDITKRGSSLFGQMPAASNLPLWFIEGMAEYLSIGPVDPNTAMWLRDAVQENKIPRIKDLDNPKYFPYRWGQAFWAFIGGRYGDRAVGQMLRAASRGGAKAAIAAVAHESEDALSEQWKSAMIDAERPILEATTPADEEGRLLISPKKHGGPYNVSPAISPDGKRLMFFSAKGLFSIDLYEADAETGSVIRKITSTAISPHFVNLEFVNSAGAWSADGRQFAFANVTGGKAELSIYDMRKDKVTRHIPFTHFGEVLNPTWSPNGSQIAISANVGGLADLFTVDVKTGAVKQLTKDAYADLQPAWSPDGRTIAFATDRFTSQLDDLAMGRYRLALLDVASGNIRELPTLQTGDSMNPQWSPDGTSVYFLSNSNGIANLYRVPVSGGETAQVTNVQTGVSGVTGSSPAFTVAAKSGALVYSAFVKGDFHIERIESPQSPSAREVKAVADLLPALLPPHARQQSDVEAYLGDAGTGLVASTNFRSVPYHPHLSLDYIAPPSFFAGQSTFGTSFGGGTQLHFSDMLNYHQVNVIGEAITDNGTQNFVRNLTGLVNYENNRHRFTWGLTGGQVPYVSGSAGVARGVASDGTPVFLQQVITTWQENRPVTAYLQYPFNRAQRLEFSGGYENIGFAAQAETEVFDVFGNLLARQTQDIPTLGSLNEGTTSAALVYDTSIFAGVSPVAGQRYRFQAGVNGGTLNFSNLLLDYRRYFHLARPLSLAGRVLHYGRYGGDSEDQRLQPLYLGYPEFVRGYNINSISPNECGASFSQTGNCPVFDQLIGSRIAVANAELRTELFGPLGLIPHTTGVPPVEIGPFYDAGVAWGKLEDPSFIGGPRKTVSSIGGFLRVNILGFAVGEISYARPHNRPLQDHVWQFTLLPGW
jgi:Tol biopolymer transport system component